MKKSYLLLVHFFFFSGLLMAQNEINIDTTKPGIKVSPSLYGIFFEEINHSGEGGLYAEMVLNRDFEITSIPYFL